MSVLEICTVPVDGKEVPLHPRGWFWKHYLAQYCDGTHPHACPLRAESLAGQPATFVITAEYDPLRDEGEAYASRLAEDGAPVRRKRYEGMIHGYQGPALMIDITKYLRAQYHLK